MPESDHESAIRIWISNEQRRSVYQQLWTNGRRLVHWPDTGLGKATTSTEVLTGHGAALEALAVDVIDDPNNGDPVVIFIAGIESFDVFCAGVRCIQACLSLYKSGSVLFMAAEVDPTPPHGLFHYKGGWVGGRGLGPHRRTAAAAQAQGSTTLDTGARICPGRRTKKRKTPKRTARRSEDCQLASRRSECDECHQVIQMRRQFHKAL